MSVQTTFAVIAALLVSACARPNYAPSDNTDQSGQGQKPGACQARFTSGHCVSYEWEKMPTEDDFGSFIFKVFLEGDDGPMLVDLAGTMTVILWMPSMGHGSSPVEVRRLDVGTYRASDVFFTMRGDWDIRFHLKDGSNVKDQAIISLTL